MRLGHTFRKKTFSNFGFHLGGSAPHVARGRVAQRYWAYGRGEKCTAPCLQGVSKEFVLIAKAME